MHSQAQANAQAHNGTCTRADEHATTDLAAAERVRSSDVRRTEVHHASHVFFAVRIRITELRVAARGLVRFAEQRSTFLEVPCRVVTESMHDQRDTGGHSERQRDAARCSETEAESKTGRADDKETIAQANQGVWRWA